MNLQSEKPWSAHMKIALFVLSASAALISILSAIFMIRQGRIDREHILPIISSGIWAISTFSLSMHPEWKRYLEEKF
jgi:hypothetical protein